MYFKKNKKKGFFIENKGFTLVEMLMVVFIVGLLSTAAVGGYMRYKKVSILDLAADNVISNLYESRDSVKYGDSDAASKCVGLKFQGDASVSKIFADSSVKKKWDNSVKKWVVSGCDYSSLEDAGVLDIDNQIKVIDIFKGGDSSSISVNRNSSDYHSCIIAFIPPSGDVYLNCEGSVLSFVSGEYLNVVLEYGGDNVSSGNDFKRIIQIDLNSAIANVKKIDD